MNKAKIRANNNLEPLLPAFRWVQAGVAFGLACALVSWAIDSGSLLQYVLAVILGGLSIRHLKQAIQARRSKK